MQAQGLSEIRRRMAVSTHARGVHTACVRGGRGKVQWVGGFSLLRKGSAGPLHGEESLLGQAVWEQAQPGTEPAGDRGMVCSFIRGTCWVHAGPMLGTSKAHRAHAGYK